jgi:flagellar protein FlaG|tara:strand:+ start:160 stop:576 length:417 start_codon:yes stop_codon:yes gene_type:complete
MNDMKANMFDRVSLVQQNAKTLSSSSAAGAYGEEQSSVVSKLEDNSVEGGKELPQNVKAIADVSKEQMKDAVSKLNDYVQSTERTLDFKMDEDSGKTVIKVYDTLSAELIRQIPNELALELAQNLNDEEPSLLFSAQV